MEDSKQEKISSSKDNSYAIPAAIVIAGIVIAGTFFTTKQNNSNKNIVNQNQNIPSQPVVSNIEKAVLPTDGVVLPVSWNGMGRKLLALGVIDEQKFQTLYESRGQFNDEDKILLYGSSTDKLKITEGNSAYLLNLLWAFGLANNNPVLDNGEMMNPLYGGAKNFASTAGWTLSKNDSMNYYSKYRLLNLTSEQQALVEKVSKGIFRPCCGNSVHFPDCNHGMAMLGLLELMASQNVSEQDMWKTALAVNSYWFPNTYITIATYMKSKGIDWKDVDPQEMLGAAYSSNQGYARISSLVSTPNVSSQSGSGCGVGGGGVVSAPVQTQTRQQGGCGI